jgi:hypothetical protein
MMKRLLIPPLQHRAIPPLQQLAKQLPTDFARFMADKLANYVEPTKEGTPRGEPIGFPLAKYKATLYALRERLLPSKGDLVSQAKELGVSYGVLKKWRSEKKFKEMVSQHEKDFAKLVFRPLVLLKGAHASINFYLELLRQASVAVTGSEPSKEALRKLLIWVHGDLRDAMSKSDASPKELKEYQQLALNHAIELLKDRRATPTHRKKIINILSWVKDTLE